MSIFKDTLTDVVQNSVIDADATREDWEGALNAVFPREERDSTRFWIQDSVVQDTPDIPMPFGDATVGIVDELEGGVILYLHEANAPRVIEALRLAAGAN